MLEVLKYPDPRLREKSLPVTRFDSQLKKLVANMFETMYSEGGIGLAAPQVNQLVRLLIVDARPNEEKDPSLKKEDSEDRYSIEDMTELEKKLTQPLVIINPEIVSGQGKTTFDEGCLSVPSFYETVERIKTIKLKYQDVEGKTHQIEIDGLVAIVIQHEMDHLDGTLFIDHLSLIKSNKIKNLIKKTGYPQRRLKSAKDPVEI